MTPLDRSYMIQYRPSKFSFSIVFAARCYAWVRPAVVRCLSERLSVCLSVTFVYCVETNKHNVNFFSPSGRHTILCFSVSNVMTVFRRGPQMRLSAASNVGGVGKNRDSQQISVYRIDDCCSANNNCQSIYHLFKQNEQTYKQSKSI